MFLAGDRAYKVKKPVLTDFLDFRAPEQRERVCAHEVLFEQQALRQTVTSASLISKTSARQCLSPSIVMRRYPDSLRLSTMASEG